MPEITAKAERERVAQILKKKKEEEVAHKAASTGFY